MKTFLGVALSALVLMAPLVSDAASVVRTAGQPLSSATASASYASQRPYAFLDYANGIHLMPISPVARRAASAPALRCGTCVLMNETGNGR